MKPTFFIALGLLCASVSAYAANDALSPETTEGHEGYVHPYVVRASVERTAVKVLIRDFSTPGLVEKEQLVERLSDIAQTDTIAFAQDELNRAEARLAAVRQEMRVFRSRTQIVDPGVDLQGRMGLLATLQQELANTLIDADLLRGTTRSDDIRLTQANARISVIEARIEAERKKLGSGGALVGGEDYASVVSAFEKLSADRAFAEQSYTLALAAYDAALAEARRKSRYLAVHIAPTRAHSARLHVRT